ncbi:MAG: M3 family oligoendopeptidase, partial [Chitinophagales bacterium]|nr:M3 family oligoendopeptidase [Chitinophagales bacterium]
MPKFSSIEYKRPDFDLLSKQFNELLTRFDRAATPEEQSQLLKSINELRKEFQTFSTIAAVRNSIDVTDAFYETEKSYFDKHEPMFRDLYIRFYKSLGNTPFKADLEKKFGNRLFKIAELALKSFNPDVIEDLQEENRLCTEYQKLIAEIQVEFKGKKLNLPQLEPYEQSIDRSEREQAVRAKYEQMNHYLKAFDALFDKLVHVRTKIAHKLGYENFIKLAYNRLGRTDYDEKDVAAFREHIQKYVVPVCSTLRKRQAERLGLEKLEFYDSQVFFKDGNPKPKGSPEWIIEKGREMYSALSPETREFFDFMIQNELMDLVAKKGKVSGGYCTHLSKYKAPFIFSNFNGTSHDVDVLTHEAGHAFQFFQSRHLDLDEYAFPTYDACEIHSMSMEYFAFPWAHLFFGDDVHKYKLLHVHTALLFLPYGTAVDEFQHIVYANPQLSPEERRKIWIDMEKKYRPEVNYSGIDFLLKGGLWMR